MPLKPGSSDKVVGENIATEIRAGKKPAQAAAIAYSHAGRSRKALKAIRNLLEKYIKSKDDKILLKMKDVINNYKNEEE
jgi:hypothetical protein